jgi:hypothetical protein
LALSSSGCSLTSLAERDSPIAVNQCDADTACPSGSSCRGSRCIAETGSLSTLLFALSTLADQLAGLQLFQTASIPIDGRNFTLTLDGVANVTGSVKTMPRPLCDDATAFKGQGTTPTYRRGIDGSIPVRMNFYPAERTLDLPASSATALVGLEAAGGMPPSSYQFGVPLPAGKYDIYIQPFDVTVVTEEMPDNCGVPPELIRGAVFDGNVQFSHQLPAFAHLDVKVSLAGDHRGEFDDWLVDMLEPLTGRLISTRAKLGTATWNDQTVPTTTTYSVGFDYLPVVENDQQVTGNEIVRLSPPGGVTAPTLLFQRSALELFTKGMGVIDQLTTLPAPIRFQGQVIDAEQQKPQSASVTLTATELVGMPKGTLASFTRTAQTRPDGTFSLELLPGTYRVLATPPAGPNSDRAPFAAAELTWKITDSRPEQAGRTIELLPARAVNGRVITPWRDAARGATITGEPTPGSLPSDVFAQSLGSLLQLVPRATSAVVDDSGAFTLYADPGSAAQPRLFDFSVRPPSGSNFAWLLMPRVALAGNGPDPVELGDLQLPAPAELDVTVVLRGDPLSESQLAGANLRVYALLDAQGVPTNDATLAKSAVPIAEASLDGSARASVLLPPALGQ